MPENGKRDSLIDNKRAKIAGTRGNASMVLEYNPALHGSKLSEQEIRYLTELEPNCTVFTPVDPELTPERVRRMKKYGRVRESATAYLAYPEFQRPRVS